MSQLILKSVKLNNFIPHKHSFLLPIALKLFVYRLIGLSLVINPSVGGGL